MVEFGKFWMLQRNMLRKIMWKQAVRNMPKAKYD